MQNLLHKYINVDGPRIQFPTLSSCPICHGMVGFYDGKTVFDKELATQIALVQHGYYLKIWEGQNVLNKKQFPFACKCTCDHEFARKSIGKCLHKLTCLKCGESITVDSSD